MAATGCEEGRSTFGGAAAKAHHLVRAQFQLTHVRFSKDSAGRNPNVVCGLVSADSGRGRLEAVEYIANGDNDSAILNDQALSFDAKPPPPAGERTPDRAAMADCVFPAIWKAMCREPLSARLMAQQGRCPS